MENPNRRPPHSAPAPKTLSAPACGQAARVAWRQRIRTLRDVERAAASGHALAIPRLLDALGHRNEAVRLAAGRALRPCGEPAFRGLLRIAAEGRGRRRLAAVACLGEWGDPRACETLLSALKQEKRERNRRLLLLFPFAFAATLLTQGYLADFWFGFYGKQHHKLRVSAANALGEIGNVGAIAALAKLVISRESEVEEAAAGALIKLLPLAASLHPEQAYLLGTNAISLLAALLWDRSSWNKDDILSRQIYQALHAVGNAHALYSVEKLAADLMRPHLADEARALLPVLQARAAQEKERTTLLRGASAPAREELLRPAGSLPTPQASEHLLRPAE